MTEHLLSDPFTTGETDVSAPNEADYETLPKDGAGNFRLGFDIPSGGASALLSEISHRVRSEFDQLAADFLRPPQDLQAFYNLCLFQDDRLDVKVSELIRNSLDNFTQAGRDGRLEVSMNAATPGTIVATVIDDGTGVPDDELESLFQAPIPSKKDMGRQHFGGRGQGLLDLKAWVDERGGAIGYTKLNPGSRFDISISTHANSYPVNELGAPPTPEEAIERLISLYYNRLHEVVVAFDNRDALTEPQQARLAEAKEWLEEELSTLQRRFVARARQILAVLAPERIE